MELQYFGGNCVRVSAKKASVVVDDNLAALGSKSITKPDDIVINTNSNIIEAPNQGRIMIGQPGEFEVSNISIQGIAARAHMDATGKKATIFKILADDIRLVITGHIYPELSDSELEAIGTVDVLVIPVGNSGYTMDAIGALKIIRKLEPKLIIPTHYSDSKLTYEVPQQDLATALKEMSMEAGEPVAKLKLKSTDLPETAQLIVLEQTA